MEKIGSCLLTAVLAPFALMGITWVLNKICWFILCVGTNTNPW
jgi:hypothetical protein